MQKQNQMACDGCMVHHILKLGDCVCRCHKEGKPYGIMRKVK